MTSPADKELRRVAKAVGLKDQKPKAKKKR
jgi:hypothetical protein